MDLTDKRQLIEYLQKNGLYTKHSLGQNFLVDRNALNKIIGAADLSNHDLVLEVGPGLGTMTCELAKNAGKVVAVELDKRLAELLAAYLLISNNQDSASTQQTIINSQLKNENCELNDCWKFNIDNCDISIINKDILRVNIPEIVGDMRYKVVANIPYYITSKIIQLFLTLPKKPEIIVVLTQKEVAERICAKPGGMSLLSVSVQAYGDPEVVDVVSASSFFPAPKVDSAILRIKNIHPFCHPKFIPGSVAAVHDERIQDQVRDDLHIGEKEFFRAVHIGFASRRKTLLNNLAAGYHISKDEARDVISSVGFGENIRAQELSVDDWKKVSVQLSKY